MKRKMILILTPFIILFIIFLLFFLANKKTIPSRNIPLLPSPTPLPSLPNSSINIPFDISQEKINLPISTSSQDQTISVTNFYKTALQINTQGDAQFINQPEKFQITYVSQFNKFIINIKGSPFNKIREEAENSFLQSLGISEEEGCKLTVVIRTPIAVNYEEAGIDYPLGFCQ